MTGGIGQGATSGIWEFMSEEFRKLWLNGMTKEDGISLSCKPLQKILDEELGYASNLGII